jgi:hypothetical protein
MFSPSQCSRLTGTGNTPGLLQLFELVFQKVEKPLAAFLGLFLRFRQCRVGVDNEVDKLTSEGM